MTAQMFRERRFDHATRTNRRWTTGKQHDTTIVGGQTRLHQRHCYLTRDTSALVRSTRALCTPLIHRNALENLIEIAEYVGNGLKKTRNAGLHWLYLQQVFDAIHGKVLELLLVIVDIAAKHDALVALRVANLVHIHVLAKRDQANQTVLRQRCQCLLDRCFNRFQFIFWNRSIDHKKKRRRLLRLCCRRLSASGIADRNGLLVFNGGRILIEFRWHILRRYVVVGRWKHVARETQWTHPQLVGPINLTPR
mmetsp:Transcript_25724/g.42014  ORF Transcript_25724/g.42014 Transcript_25724/m.42014 type:complete len:251 (-) Transcript_25724:232-984(-)